MRQAIQTKYFGPTNFRGARIKAECSAGSIIIGWDYSKDVEGNHEAALCALRMKLDWCKHAFQGGQLKDSTYVWTSKS